MNIICKEELELIFKSSDNSPTNHNVSYSLIIAVFYAWKDVYL